jgi:hypothetical protein
LTLCSPFTGSVDRVRIVTERLPEITREQGGLDPHRRGALCESPAVVDAPEPPIGLGARRLAELPETLDIGQAAFAPTIRGAPAHADEARELGNARDVLRRHLLVEPFEEDPGDGSGEGISMASKDHDSEPYHRLVIAAL